MVRNKKAVDLSWFDLAPEVLIWGQVTHVFRRYRLSAQEFALWAKYKPRPIMEYPNGDMEQGYLKSDVKRFMKLKLKERAHA